MKPSLRGGRLPESKEDFNQLKSEGGLRHSCCVSCTEYFHEENVHTKLGWAETQISGMREDCFDSLFKED